MKFLFLTPDELKPYQSNLMNLEKHFQYPFDKNHTFFISHGTSYGAFFESMGETRFCIGIDEQGSVVAIIALVLKYIPKGNKVKKALYLGDLKIHPEHQGRGLSLSLYKFLLLNWRVWQFTGIPTFLFFVSMCSKKGSVLNTFSHHFLRYIVQPFAILNIYMISPSILANLKTIQVKQSQTVLANLNTAKYSSLIINMQGFKDICFHNTEAPLKLGHINLETVRGDNFLETLKKAGKTGVNQGYETLCFAVDMRRTELVKALENQKIVTDSRAIIAGIQWPWHSLKTKFITINTNEI